MKINSALLALALNNFVARMNYKLRFVQPKKIIQGHFTTLLSVSVHKFMFHFIISKFLRTNIFNRAKNIFLAKITTSAKFACTFENIRDEHLVFEIASLYHFIIYMEMLSQIIYILLYKILPPTNEICKCSLLTKSFS